MCEYISQSVLRDAQGQQQVFKHFHTLLKSLSKAVLEDAQQHDNNSSSSPYYTTSASATAAATAAAALQHDDSTDGLLTPH
jgi:hypothetical protein